MKTQTPLQFAAYIEHVKEVALYGTADLAFWRGILAQEHLFPQNTHGKAGILISVPQLLWKGARFNELSISLAVSHQKDGTTFDGYFLVRAFNSLRFFAFAERTFFKTPYYYAVVQVSENIPARFQVKHGAETVFEGRMDGANASPRQEEVHFEGPVYLPGQGGYFIARISGMTDFYPFSSTDTLSIQGTSPEKVFQQLLDSSFTPLEWQIRGDAVHGKSKTYRMK